MTTENQLEDLLLEWESLRRQGRHVTAAELCVDCPELADELARRIQALDAYDTVGASTKNDPMQTVDAPNVPNAPSGGMLTGGMSPLPGYVLLKRLGRGGFGEVWEASAPGGFRVALKFVDLDVEKSDVEASSLDIVRTLRHPNLLSTFGAWREAGRLIIAMELADRTLLDRFREAVEQGHVGIPRDELLEYLREAANGIDYLNEARHAVGDKQRLGIQHRDIKPQNILLVGSGVKLADFGLVRFLEHSVTGHTGILTPMYAAPEFFNGRTTSSSDQYSLGITYCHLRGGKIPFGTSPAELIAGHITGKPDLSMLPTEERSVVARALAKNPTERWPTCKEFVRALAACVPVAEPLTPVAEPSPSAPPRRSKALAVVAAVSLLIVVIAAIVFVNQKTPSPGLSPQPVATRTENEPPKIAVPSDAKTPEVPSKEAVVAPTKKLPPRVDPHEPLGVPGFKLIAPQEVTLMWGETKALTIEIRRQGADDAVTLSIKDLPPNVTCPVVEAAAGRNQIAMEVTADLQANETETEVVVHGKAGAATAEVRVRLAVVRPTGQIRTMTGHKGGVRAAAFLPDGRHAVSAGDDGCAIVWNLETSKRELRIECHDKGITGLVVVDGGRRIVTASLDHSLRIWSTATGDAMGRFDKHTSEVESVAIAPDGLTVLSGDRKAGLWLWDVKSGNEIRQFKGAEESLWSLAFRADGSQAYSGGYSKFVRVWDVDKGTPVDAIDIGLEAVQTVAVVPGAAPALVAAGEGKNRPSIQYRKLDKEAMPRGFDDYRVVVGAVAVSKASPHVLSAGSDHTVRLWDLATFTEIARFDKHQDVVYAVAFSPDGRMALSASRDGTVRLWVLPK